jgi:maleamate amidohydrolase
MATGTWHRRIGFGARPAVLVVDMTRAFTEPDRPLGSDVSPVISPVNSLTAAARAVGADVIFSAIVYSGPGDSDAGLWRLKVGGQEDLRNGQSGVEIDPRLERRVADGFLVKKYASCFFGTDLASRLIARGIDTLVLAGCSTSVCVRATAVDAIQYGFRPMVAREAVCDRWPSAHEQALLDMDAKYADVMSTADAIAGLRA